MARGTGVVQGADQRLDRIDDSDRLHHGVHPGRHGVHGHPFADLSDYLERGGPAAQEYRRAQYDHGRGGLAQDLLDLTARGDVIGEVLVRNVRHDPGEVDDPGDTLGAHCAREVGGRLAVGLREVVTAHPVDQVVDRIHALAGDRDLLVRTVWPRSSSRGTSRPPT